MLRTTASAAFLALLAILGDRAAADEAARRDGLGKAADLHRRLRDAEKAKKGDEVKALLPQFREAVQAAAPHLPAVTPEETAKPKAYHKLTLNAGNTRLDGFR